MQLTLKLPDPVPNEKMVRLIAEIKRAFTREGVAVEIDEKTTPHEDTWDSLDISAISVDTGIEDFAENHDHYLYGLPKRS